jgi:hypothetical protein
MQSTPSMKPRADAKLLNLPQDQQELICSWLTEGVETADEAGDTVADTSYRAVKKRIWNDLGIATSDAALSAFYRKIVAPRVLRSAVVAAEQFTEEADANGVKFSAAAKQLVKQKFFELTANGQCSPQQLATFGSLVADFDRGDLKREDQRLKAEDLKVKLRRLDILEANVAAAKAEVAKLRDPQASLSDADRAAIVGKVDEILGIK